LPGGAFAGTIGRVTSDDLTPAQLAALAAQCARHRDYLTRLRDRMHALGFPVADPIYAAAVGACDAVSNLTVVTSSKRARASRRLPDPTSNDGRSG
jgi:hypothetical protein